VARHPDLLPAGPVERRRWARAHAEVLPQAVATNVTELHRWMPWAAERPTEEGMRSVVA
jgi:hypothetical protein